MRRARYTALFGTLLGARHDHPAPDDAMIDNTYLRKRTGYKQSAAIKRWLRRHHVHFWSDAKGNPLTTQAEIDRAFDRGRDDVKKPRFLQKGKGRG